MIKIFVSILVFTTVNAILGYIIPKNGSEEVSAFYALTFLGMFGCIISFFVAMCYTWKEKFSANEEEEFPAGEEGE